MNGVRMDIWLWAARFFKTRPMAKRACELGRILSNGQPAKASREVRIGDRLRVTNEGGDFQIEVLLLSEVRGRAGNYARKWQRNGKQCVSSRFCRRAGHRNATDATSSASAVEYRDEFVQHRHPLGALRRLRHEKWIERSKQEDRSRGRQAYRLTPRGGSHLQLEMGRMKHLTRLANLRVAVKES